MRRYAPRVSSAPPLSHHALLDLVAPFVPDGWRLDLAATDRAARRVVFQAQQLAAGDGVPALRVDLRLEPDEAHDWRLVRETRLAVPPSAALGALVARAEALGDRVDDLWRRVGRVDAARQWPALEGTLAVALSFRVLAAAGQPRVVLREAEALLATGLRWHMTVSGVGGYPAEFTLMPVPGAPAPPRRLPDDLMTVRHRAWQRLMPVRQGWQGSVALRGEGTARSADAEARLREGLQHLAQTLAEPPARFHARHRAARWAEALRRTGPVAVGLAVVALALWLGRDSQGNASALGALANLVPPLLMGLFFMRREMPRLELPRPPRRLRPDDWTPAPPVSPDPR